MKGDGGRRRKVEGGWLRDQDGGRRWRGEKEGEGRRRKVGGDGGRRRKVEGGEGRLS